MTVIPTQVDAVVLKGGQRHRFGFTVADWAERQDRAGQQSAEFPDSAWPLEYVETTRIEILRVRTGRDGKDLREWPARVWEYAGPRDAPT